MSCKSAIYTANTTATAVAVGSAIPLGTIIRRFGNNVNLSGNGIIMSGSGYYDVNASITLTPTAAGTVTVSLLRDGVAIPGATASETVAAAATTVNLSIPALVRLQCCNSSSTLTFVLTGAAATVNNIGVVVTKV